MNGEDEIEGYVTQDSEFCFSCAFAYTNKELQQEERDLLCLRARCMSDQREDGRSVIFVKIQLDNQPKL